MRRSAATALSLILMLAACSDPSATSSSTVVTTPTTAPAITTTTNGVTTSSQTGWERPPVCDCPDEIATTIPVGEDGVTYRDVGTPEVEPNGPSALDIDDERGFVVLDTPGQEIVLATSDAITRIPLHWEGIQALLDVQPTPSGFVILDLPFGNNQPRLVILDSDGAVKVIHVVPEGLWLENGLSGIDLSPDGEVWVELEGGNHVASLDLDTMEYILHDGYPFPGGLYRSLTFSEPTTLFEAGDVTVEIESRFGGQMASYLIGVNPDNSFVIQTTELIQDDDGLLRAITQASWYEKSGGLIATAELPLEDRFIFVDHPVVLGNDGYLYYLVPTEDVVEIRKLGWQSPDK